MSSLPRTGVLCALALAFAGSVFAQPPGQLKKAPNQVAPSGQHDDPAPPQTGRAREATPEETAALEAALQSFGKRAEGATFTILDNGMVRAELDDSFMEAMTVTVMPDGSLKYGHAKVAARKAVEKTGKSVQKTTTADAKKQAAPVTVTAKSPVLEDKE
jgi:hypothetical protein